MAIIAAVYGTNFGCVKLLDQTLSPSLAAALRFGLASAALLPLAFATRPNPSLFLPLLAGVETGLWSILAYGAQSVSLQTVSAGKSAFICALCVLVVPLLDLFKGESPPRRAWIAAALATVGVAVLELGDAGGAVESLTRDDWLSLLQPLGFGLGFWRMEAFGRRFPRDALPLAAGQVTGVAAAAAAWAAYDLGCFSAPSLADGISLGCAGLQAAASDVAASSTGAAVVLGTLAWTGFASTAATVLGESVALTQLSASEATLIFSTEPLWGAAFAYVALGETLGTYAVAGGALIVGTCLWNAKQRSLEQSALVSTQVYGDQKQ